MIDLKKFTGKIFDSGSKIAVSFSGLAAYNAIVGLTHSRILAPELSPMTSGVLAASGLVTALVVSYFGTELSQKSQFNNDKIMSIRLNDRSY